MSTENKDTRDAESITAEKIARKGNPPQDVFSWLHQAHYGTLGTLNTHEDTLGYPTGSIVPFALDRYGRPFIFIANIAAHTRNMKRDNRASLFLSNETVSGDPQSTWRASVIGNFSKLVTTEDAAQNSYSEKIDVQEEEELMARYIERVPKAKSYSRTHGFHFWRMSDIKSIRYIAGFGRICWILGQEYLDLVSPNSFTKMRVGAMQHMNDDHQNNMQEICRAFHGVEDTSIQMTSLDMNGCLFQSQETKELYYSSFPKVVEKAGDFKSQIIKLLGKARKHNAAQEQQ